MSFDTLAPFYHALETVAFGQALQKARTTFLDRLRGNRRALCVGEGDGRFLTDLLRANPFVEVDCVEQSSAMLRLARKNIAACDAGRRVCFQQLDVRALPAADARYDLIVTNFFLDCFSASEASEVVTRLAAMAEPQGHWLIAEFNLPPQGLPRLHARVWLRAMYEFFGLTTDIRARQLPIFGSLVRDAGFELEMQRDARCGLIRSQLWRRSHT